MDLAFIAVFALVLCLRDHTDIMSEDDMNFEAMDRDTKLNEEGRIEEHAFERISNELLRRVRGYNSTPSNFNT